jgi:hypothetical protein
MLHMFSDVQFFGPLDQDSEILGHLRKEFDMEKTIINQEAPTSSD